MHSVWSYQHLASQTIITETLHFLEASTRFLLKLRCERLQSRATRKTKFLRSVKRQWNSFLVSLGSSFIKLPHKCRCYSCISNVNSTNITLVEFYSSTSYANVTSWQTPITLSIHYFNRVVRWMACTLIRDELNIVTIKNLIEYSFTCHHIIWMFVPNKNRLSE